MKKKQMRKRINELETMVKRLEQENFNLFCDRYAETVRSSIEDAKDILVEPPLEPLPKGRWWGW